MKPELLMGQLQLGVPDKPVESSRELAVAAPICVWCPGTFKVIKETLSLAFFFRFGIIFA
jgi:hypothetical protein